MNAREKINTNAPERKGADSASKIRSPESSPSTNSLIGRILHLQKIIGNQAVQRLIKSGTLLTKSEISHPNAIYTQVADTVAVQSRRLPNSVIQIKPTLQLVKPSPYGEDETIQSKPPTNQIIPLVQHQSEESEKEQEISIVQESSGKIPLLQMQPASAPVKVVLKRALLWLSKRGKTVSKHVVKHTRVVAQKAVHTVFKKPNQIKKLVEKALLAPDNTLVQQGARKTRYVVEKQFEREIGKGGETILHVVLDTTGRIVTAYPVKSFTAAGALGGILTMAIDESVAQAREEFTAVETEAEKMLEAAEPTFLEDLFSDIITFGLYGGTLNQGEDVYLWVGRETQRIMQQACSEVIDAVESDEMRILSDDEKKEICDIVNAALADPTEFEEAATEE